jgi:DNA-3-methyladenine glycosylase II
MRVLESPADIAAATALLIAREPRFAVVVEAHGLPPLRRHAAGLEGLLRIVTDQLISLQAGAAIWARIAAELSPFDAALIARKRQSSLMKLGLSGAKARCFRGLAKAVAEGRLDFQALESLSDDAALRTLTSHGGIGPWTADIYLLSAMGRADAFPAGDLALQVGAQHLLDLGRRPSPVELVTLAESWRPYRAVAARLLWSHYRGLRGMGQNVA